MLIKITKRNVDAAKSGEKDLFFWDRETKGFGLKVTPAARKVYVLQYRMGNGPTKRYTIGTHGAPWTPETARNNAIEHLASISKGIDPIAAKKAQKADISVAELCEIYLNEGVRTKKESTITLDRSRINSHVLPLIGGKRLKELSRSDIEKFMADVASGKTAKNSKTGKHGRAIVRGGEGSANRTLGMLGAIFEFAVVRELIPNNPVRGIRKFKERKLERFLSSDEMIRLGDALRESEANGVNAFAIAAIRLLMLTGCRKSEIISLRWDEVDFETGFLRLKDSKTGSKSIYLTAPAKEVLAALPRNQGNPYVIAGEKANSHLVGLQKIWNGIRKQAGLVDLRLHDLRHSFASIGARSGESLLVIGKVLGHSTTAATSRYAHLSDDPVMSAAENIAGKVAANLTEQKENIVPIKSEILK